MRKALYLGTMWSGAAAAILIFWIVLYEVFNHFGFNNQATPYYGFTSGPAGPVLTAVLGSTILTGIWHSLNCHEATCWRLGKHKVNGTPWCGKHQSTARPQATAEELLFEQSKLLQRQNALLGELITRVNDVRIALEKK